MQNRTWAASAIVTLASDATAQSFMGIGDLAGGSSFSGAEAISADGSTVVGTSSSPNDLEAYRWDATGGMVGLGYLPGRDFGSNAFATNADGSVVVGDSAAITGEVEAILWTADAGLRTLFSILTDDFGFDLSDWTLTEAIGISVDGRTIVGNGVNPNGQREAFIATIPAPASVLLLSVAALPIAPRRGR